MVGGGYPKRSFPFIFSFSVLQEVFVAAMGGWINNGMRRCSDLRIPVSTIIELNLGVVFTQLIFLQQTVNLFPAATDSMVWLA